MRRTRIQPKNQALKKRTPRKRTSKPPMSLAELLLNWVIVILIVLILGFVASIIWKYTFAKKNIFVQEPTISQRQTVTKKIRVEVLNGCGVTGVAIQFTDYLRSQGFDVVITENYRSFDVDSSFVIDRVSLKSENALQIARSLGIPDNLVNAILSDDLAVEATIVLGSDYTNLKGYSDVAQ